MVVTLEKGVAAAMAGSSSIDCIGFIFSSFNVLVRSRYSRLARRSLWESRRLGKVWRFNSELFCVLGVQLLPAELHRLATNDAADRSPTQQPVQNIETNLPSGSAH